MKGFTLIEVIVTLVIVGILATVVIINFRPQDSLDRSTQELASLLRLAQADAVAGKTGTTTGFGVYFVPPTHQYFFYADQNGNFNYDEGEEIETKSTYLPTRLVNCNYLISPYCNLFFSLPDGVIYGATETNLTITLRDVEEREEKIIIINSTTGLISY